MQHGAEYLALQLSNGLNLERSRCEEGAGGALTTERALINESRLLCHAGGVCLQYFQRGGVDHRAHVGAEPRGIADGKLGHGAGKHLHGLVRDIGLQVEHAQSRATLAGALECGCDGVAHDLLGQCRGIHDHGVLATGFGNQRYDGAAFVRQHPVNGTRGFR